MATAAPRTILTLIKNERARRCFPGAMAAPAGLDAATPLVFISGAAAVPTGFGGLLCCGSWPEREADAWPLSPDASVGLATGESG